MAFAATLIPPSRWLSDDRHRVPGAAGRPPAGRLGRPERRQARTKTRSWAALAAHVATYHLVMGALLLLPILRDGWPPWKALLALLVSAATHALIDRRWPVRALLTASASPGFATLEWGVIAVDQALHLTILALLAVLLG